MNSLQLLTCAGPGSLDRVLIICGAVVQQGGSVILLTYTPGLALRRTYFGMEVVVRRQEDLSSEILRLEALALSRGGAVVLFDDPRVREEHAGALSALAQSLCVACYGPPLSKDIMAIDPYATSAEEAARLMPAGHGLRGEEACLGLRYLPLHPGLRRLRGRRIQEDTTSGRLVSEQASHIVVCLGSGGARLIMHVLAALSVWRRALQVGILCGLDMGRSERAAIDPVVRASLHDVKLLPCLPEPSLGEALLCDLAIVEGADIAASAACLGTPVIALSRTAEEHRRCAALALAHAAIHLPLFDGEAIPEALLADIVWTLLSDPSRRAALSIAGRRVVDGYGAERVAAALLELQRGRCAGMEPIIPS